jgi:multidrug efflux system outer membrane protein
MRSARAKLREARARRKLAGAEHFPTVTGSTSISLSKTGGTAADLYSASFDASWEPDVFGATRRAEEAAQADLEATGASLHDTQVSLVAEVAANYVELRAYQGRLKIAKENLATQTETFELTSW